MVSAGPRVPVAREKGAHNMTDWLQARYVKHVPGYRYVIAWYGGGCIHLYHTDDEGRNSYWVLDHRFASQDHNPSREEAVAACEEMARDIMAL